MALSTDGSSTPTKAKVFSDVAAPTASPTVVMPTVSTSLPGPTSAAPVTPNPSISFHGQTPAAATPAVLDLRNVKPMPSSPSPTPVTVKPEAPLPIATAPKPVMATDVHSRLQTPATPARVQVAVTGPVPQKSPESITGPSPMASTPKPMPITPVSPKPIISAPAPTTPAVTRIDSLKPTPPTSNSAPEPTPVPITQPTAQPAGPTANITPIVRNIRVDERQANAQAIGKLEGVSRFGAKPVVVPTPAPVAPVLTTQPASTEATPQVFMPTARPAATPVPSIIAASAPSATTLPNAVATQVDSMAKATGIDPAKPHLTHDQVMDMAMKTNVNVKAPALRPVSMVAALAAVTIMAGYIWVNNYPKMSIKTASNKAGIEASLPGYVPSNYSLGNSVASAPGTVTLSFNSTSQGSGFEINQRATDWNSTALFDNFVAKASKQYLAVQGQGLTIYLYNDGQASWINHGIWYNINSASGLSRDELLKIAYSL